MQVEGDAKMLRKTTEQLAERTEALKKELATQKEEFSQRLFEAQQENNQVRSPSLMRVILNATNCLGTGAGYLAASHLPLQ